MSFQKIAFKRPEHEKITKYMMGDRFDAGTFDAVHRYIDQAKGAQHRERHGHDEAAEQAIGNQWGSAGVEIFRIHLLSDWLYDNLGPAVDDLFRKLELGEFPLPYYDHESAAQRPPFSAELQAAAPQCVNCGSEDGIDILRSWLKGPVCSQCLDVRHLELCVQCNSFFARGDRTESPENPGRYLCPICA